jgi:hypothetical protein
MNGLMLVKEAKLSINLKNIIADKIITIIIEDTKEEDKRVDFRERIILEINRNKKVEILIERKILKNLIEITEKKIRILETITKRIKKKFKAVDKMINTLTINTTKEIKITIRKIIKINNNNINNIINNNTNNILKKTIKKEDKKKKPFSKKKKENLNKKDLILSFSQMPIIFLPLKIKNSKDSDFKMLKKINLFLKELPLISLLNNLNKVLIKILRK